MSLQALLLGLVALVALVLGLAAWRRPVLFRMAVRNATRRPRQTLTVIAGLMVGTAIISSALVAGDSAGSAIRGAVHDALGPVDEQVHIQGYPFFPQRAGDALFQDPEVQGFFDGAAPNILWSAAADSPRTDLFEPETWLVGFDPERDAAFGDFHLAGGGTTQGRDLAPDEAIVTQDLAEAMDLRVGDRLRVAYTLPMDPVRPEVLPLEGEVTGATPVGPEPLPQRHDVPVGQGAVRLTVVLGWDPGPLGASLQVDVLDPEGRQRATAGNAADPQVPLWLNVTADGTLTEGTWQVVVRGAPALETPYQGAAIVQTPAYGDVDLGDLPETPPGAPDPEDLLGDLARREAELRVAAIADGGRADQYDLGGAAFLHLDALQELLEREGQVNSLKFSNPGGVEAGAARTDEAMAVLEAALERVKQDDDHPAVQALRAEPIKQDLLEVADNAGRLFTGFILFAGSLSILTGLLLIVNIFTMLAEERRSELGMARAVGLQRGDLVRLFTFEGSLYAVAAAAAGAVLGLGLAWIMVRSLNALMASRGAGFPPVPFLVDPANLVVAFAAGALLTFLTIFFASRRASRLNIVRAIRRIEEPQRAAGRWTRIVGAPLMLGGLIATAAGWLFAQFSLQVFGPLAAAVGMGLLLRRDVPRHRLDPALAAVLAVYYAASFFLITEFSNLDEANLVGPIRGVLMTLAVVLIVAYWEGGPRRLGRLLARVRSLRAVAKPAMGYPQHKRFRTGMTLAMFSIVLLSIGFFSVFGALFDVDPARQTGGFDVEATTTLDVDGLAGLAEHDRGLVPEGTFDAWVHVEDHFAFGHGFITVEGQQVGRYGPPGHHVYGVGEDFVQEQDFRLISRHEDYPDDAAAYQELLVRDDVVIVGYMYSSDERNQDLAFDVGDTLEMHFGERTRAFTIIGIQEQYHFPGVFVGKDLVRSVFPASDDLFLGRLAPGHDAEDVAKLMEQNHRDVGLDASASQVQVQEEQKTYRQILGAMRLFLGLGLIVGVLSLGIVTGRSVLERRQEIGMLRAIGFTGAQVRTAFLLEVTLIVAAAAVIGIASSLIVSYGLWYAVIRGLQFPFVVPWVDLLLLTGVAYLVALAATWAPIRSASRIPPAEAVRYIE